MSRRLEIELTSRRDDGTWTWRAAGARQPKGDVAADLVPDSAVVGSVLKAEADGSLDGLRITALFAPRARAESPDRLKLIGGGAGPLVTTALTSKSRRGRSADFEDDRKESRDRRRSRGSDDHRDRGPRRQDQDPDRQRPDGQDRRSRRSDRDGGESRSRRSDRDGGESRSRRSDRDGGESRSRRGARTDGHGSGRAGDRKSNRSSRPDGDRRSQTPQRSKGSKGSTRPRLPALKAKNVHRRASLAALPEDQRPLGREVLRGGVPGVRKSIERMNAKAAAESLPLIKSEPILALAEQLALSLKAAEWHDRADAALAGISKVDLRDIRSVIAAAERCARTDETRALAESLRTGLAQRVEADHRKWLDELAGTIHDGRTVRALRLSSRPPKAGAPLPPDMAERLATLAAADLNSTANQQRWATVVDAVVLSPVRTQVVPVGVPKKPADELLTTVRRLADRVPQIASLFGVEPEPARRGPRRTPPPPPSVATEPEAEAEPTPEPEAEAEPTPEPAGEAEPDTTPEPAGEAP